MRLMPALIAALFPWLAVAAFVYFTSVRAIDAPAEPQATFRRPMDPNNTAFDLLSLTDAEALLAWTDDSGVHRVKMSRKDFDGMFGTVRVEPLTPEEQQARKQP